MKGHAFMTICLALATGACSTSTRELSLDQRNAREAIDRAEQEGAKKYSRPDLEAAKTELEMARSAENAALRDRQEARDALVAAQTRDERAKRRMSLRRGELEDAETERQNDILAIDAAGKRADELRSKGVSEDEVSQLTDGHVAMLKVKVRSLESDIRAAKEDISAMESVRGDAQMEVKTSRARLKTAEERLTAARASYVRVEERANLARAQALDTRRTMLAEKIEAMNP
jgi:chromosome segregation ATPase